MWGFFKSKFVFMIEAVQRGVSVCGQDRAKGKHHMLALDTKLLASTCEF